MNDRSNGESVAFLVGVLFGAIIMVLLFTIFERPKRPAPKPEVVEVTKTEFVTIPCPPPIVVEAPRRFYTETCIDMGGGFTSCSGVR